MIGGLGLLVLLPAPASAPGIAPERRTTLGCLELKGVIGPTREFNFRCQLSALLDNPIDDFIGPEDLGAADSQPHTQVGVVNPRLAKNLLGAGRCFFSQEEFASLDALPLLDQRDVVDPNPVSRGGDGILGTADDIYRGQKFGMGQVNGVARAARAVALRDPEREATVDLDGDGLPDHPMHTLLSNLEGESLVVERDENGRPVRDGDGVPVRRKVRYFDSINGLGFDPSDPTSVTNRFGFDRLLDARPDRDRAHDLASPGFDGLDAADTVCELALGMEEPVDLEADQNDPVLNRPADSSELAGKALFIGPDGLKGTADELPIRMCPPGTVPETTDFGSGEERFAGSRCVDPTGVLVEPLYYLAGDPAASGPGLLDVSGVSSEEAAARCRQTVRIEWGGLNMNGECIQLSTDQRVGRFNAALSGPQRRTVAAKRFLQDPALRPASAIREPTNLTDLRLRSGGISVPARPHAPGGGLVYPNATPFSRRVDPTTGAPIRAFGPLTCAHRTNGMDQRLGPDGLRSDTLSDLVNTDNDIPTLGNCLLWDNPGADPSTEDGLAVQSLRLSDEIAQSHTMNQGLVARLCTQSFDEDLGQCSLDFLNDPTGFRQISNALSGRGGLGGILADGLDSLRLQSDDPLVYYDDLGRNVFVQSIFAKTASFEGGVSQFSSQLSTEEEALLGCGPAFVSVCDSGQVEDFDPPGSAFRRAIGVEDARIALVGGIGLPSAEASVVIQEWGLRRATAAGSLVGVTGHGLDERFEAGIRTKGITVSEAKAAGDNATLMARDAFLAATYPGLPGPDGILGTPDDVPSPKGSVAGFRVLIDSKVGIEKENLRNELATSGTDFQVEPTRWIRRDPNSPTSAFLEPDVGPDGIVGTTDDDYLTAGNPTGTVNPLGENCSPLYGGPEPGCTPMEILSSNLERALIGAEIVGQAGVPDPYETFAELVAMWDGDPSNDILGDPIAGEDAIVFNDFDLDGDGIISHEHGVFGTDQKAIAMSQGEPGQVADSFDLCVAHATSKFCFLNLERGRPIGERTVSPSPSDPRLVAVLPVAWKLAIGRNTFDPVLGLAPMEYVPIQKLTPLELQQLEAFDQVTVDAEKIGKGLPGETVTLFRTAVLFPSRPPTSLGSLLQIDLDSESGDTRVRNLDQDGDHTLDFVDDDTPGPGVGGNFLCGSGIPGDPLQDAQQVDFDEAQAALLAAAGGIPARSPEFCAGIGELMALTGPTREGRRAFLWQGATPAERIDGNADGEVDLNDLQAIIDNLNTAAGADDPLDLDGDGQLTVLDARKAALLCTRPGCADGSGVAPDSLEEFLAGAGAGAAPTAVPVISFRGVLVLSLLLVGTGALGFWRVRT